VKRQLFVVDWQRCLGAGGEGEVYLARAMDTAELYAVKVSSLLDPVAAAEHLRAERDRCLVASGEGAVGLVAWNLGDKRPFLVFEFAHAGTLADEMSELRESGRVYHPVQALLRIREVLAALVCVHGRGLIHRDVKPANLLRFGTAVKFTDFGSGLAVGDSKPLETEAFIGTRMYAAPEQRRGEAVDERADLYAVGCILYEMLCGVAFDRGSCSRAYPNALVLPELDRFVSALLAADPDRRPTDGADAVRRVDRILAAYARARSVWGQLGLGPSPY
jgi:serine/threonine-protein kinase